MEEKTKEINIGEHVKFEDEFGKIKEGKVVSTNPYGMTELSDGELFIGIHKNIGTYVRKLEEVEKVQQ